MNGVTTELMVFQRDGTKQVFYILRNHHPIGMLSINIIYNSLKEHTGVCTVPYSYLLYSTPFFKGTI